MVVREPEGGYAPESQLDVAAARSTVEASVARGGAIMPVPSATRRLPTRECGAAEVGMTLLAFLQSGMGMGKAAAERALAGGYVAVLVPGEPVAKEPPEPHRTLALGESVLVSQPEDGLWVEALDHAGPAWASEKHAVWIGPAPTAKAPKHPTLTPHP